MMTNRKIIQEHFQKDINLFVEISGLSVNIMLKITKVKLKLINNQGICNFFRKSIRDIISFIAIRTAKSDCTDTNEENCKK